MCSAYSSGGRGWDGAGGGVPAGFHRNCYACACGARYRKSPHTDALVVIDKW